MPKYVLEEDAIKTTWMILNGLGYYEGDNVSLVNDVRSVFDTAPAADVVEVVRCGECINRSSKFSTGREYYCMKSGVFRSLEFFCADGERKAGGQSDA